MVGNIWRLAPMTTITIAAIAAAGLVVMSTLLALSGPWLGIVFDRSYDGAGIRVERVVDNSPSAGKLTSGDTIVAFEAPSQQRVEVSSLATQEDPDYAASYAEFNAFMALQQRVSQAIAAPSFTVVLEDGRKILLEPAAAPGPAILPAAFWWLMLFGGASLAQAIPLRLQPQLPR